jgi:hypothetical protein
MVLALIGWAGAFVAMARAHRAPLMAEPTSGA